jgi:hypothetical protein
MAFYNRFRGNKYGNHKIIINGIKYDSEAEAVRGEELRELEAAGEIYNLRRQVPFELLPAQYEPDRTGKRGAKIKGKLIERATNYIADFVYINKDGFQVVEDVKGMRTKEYILKRKMLLYFHGIRISEISTGKRGKRDG